LGRIFKIKMCNLQIRSRGGELRKRGGSNSGEKKSSPEKRPWGKADWPGGKHRGTMSEARDRGIY